MDKSESLITYIQDAVIGKDDVADGPLGPRGSPTCDGFPSPTTNSVPKPERHSG